MSRSQAAILEALCAVPDGTMSWQGHEIGWAVYAPNMPAYYTGLDAGPGLAAARALVRKGTLTEGKRPRPEGTGPVWSVEFKLVQS